MHSKINIKYIESLFQVVLCRILLDMCYVYIIVPNYKSEGYALDYSYYVISWILYILFTPIIAQYNSNAKKPSDFVMLFLCLFSFIPFTTMMGLHGFCIEYIIYASIFWAMLFLFNQVFNHKVSICLNKHKCFFSKNIQRNLICVISFIAIAVILYVSGKYRHFAINFDINKVYIIRSMASKFNLPTLLNYLLNMAGVVILILILYLFWIKRYILGSFLVCIQLLNFGIGSHKSILFQLVIGLGIFLFYERLLKDRFMTYMNILLGLSLLEFFKNNTFWIAGVVIRRVCFIPNYISLCSFDFFTTHRPDYFAQSFLRHFGIHSPYGNISTMISAKYFHDPLSMANNGLISDAITNYGMLGAYILPVLYCILFRILDEVSRTFPPEIYVVFALMVACSILSTFLPTALLTSGILIICLCLHLLSRRIQGNKEVLLHAK